MTCRGRKCANFEKLKNMPLENYLEKPTVLEFFKSVKKWLRNRGLLFEKKYLTKNVETLKLKYHVGDSLRCFLKLCEANSENSNFRENLNPGGGGVIPSTWI